MSKNIFLHSWSIHEVMDPKLKRFYQPKFILLSIVSEYYYFLYKINKSLRVIQVDFRWKGPWEYNWNNSFVLITERQIIFIFFFPDQNILEFMKNLSLNLKIFFLLCLLKMAWLSYVVLDLWLRWSLICCFDLMNRYWRSRSLADG